jgi:hypothetical protein
MTLSRVFKELCAIYYRMGMANGYSSAVNDLSSQLGSALGLETVSSTGFNYSNEIISFIEYNWEVIIAKMASAFVECQEEKIMIRLKEIYEISNWYEISQFLKEHPYLMGLLFDAYNKIKEFFGTSIHVRLEIVNDPEIEDETSLCAYIYTDLSVDEALSNLKKLDHEWFLDNAYRARGRFNIDVAWI